MKKYLKLLIIPILFIITGCGGVGNEVVNTEYSLGENATIDNIDITCNDYEILPQYNGISSKNGSILKVNFKLTNNTAIDITLYPKNYFSFISNEGIEIYPESESYITTLEKGKTIDSYDVIFDIKKQDTYKVLFYSNVVTNNIAFKLYKD